jgi:hypothetical protein
MPWKRPFARKSLSDVRGGKFHTITDIVGTLYCEQKVVYDQARGDARPLEIKAKAVAGTVQHWRFQVEGQTQQVMDRRCYIATHVYGEDASETEALRRWRDEVLRQTALGRLATVLYYRISPALVRLFGPSHFLTAITRQGLNRLIRHIGRSA